MGMTTGELTLDDVAATSPLAQHELAALRAELNLLTHKIICCGVAASHPDVALTTHGAYAGPWNSQQAEEVRKLRAERDALRALQPNG